MFVEEIILGLDISTSITGFALVDSKSGELLLYDHIDLRKKKCIFEKAEYVKQYLLDIKLSATYLIFISNSHLLSLTLAVLLQRPWRYYKSLMV